MTVYLLYNKSTVAERKMADLGGKLEEAKVNFELVDADTPRGISVATDYDVMARPAIILTSHDGGVLEVGLPGPRLMLVTVISIFTDLFVLVYTFLLIARVVASYVAKSGGQFYKSLVIITEPVISPVRKILPQTPGLDLAPLVTYIILRGIQYLVHNLLGA